jgi:cell wall-associated NlpC family hydrolase
VGILVEMRLLIATLAATGACALGLAACGSGEQPATAPAPQRASADVRAPASAETQLPPLPKDHEAKVVEPVAGAGGASAAPATGAKRTRAQQAPPTAAPKPSGSASPSLSLSRPDTAGDGTHQATALPNGIALPPLEAPEAVRAMIEAGNVIARSPYVWGGGHGKWVDKGYDCSGSVSFVLAAAGYLDSPLASGPLMSWGEPGPGKWVTIYANGGHVWMTVAGIRFDTSGQRVTGSRWQNDMRPTGGFAVRHPPGL